MPCKTLTRFWDGERLKFAWACQETLTLDGRARPTAFTWEGRQYRRGLDGTCKEILRLPGPSPAIHDAALVTEEVCTGILAGWAERLQRYGYRCGNWLARLRADAREFRSIYQSVSILPPDQYRSLVFQLTEGCAYNRCSFCQLYRDRPYRCKDGAAFAEHMGRVLGYFGAALPWRRGIFLGDANAGGLPTSRLVDVLKQIRRCFPMQERDGQGRARHPLQFERVSCFQDAFSGPLRSQQDWYHLRALGLFRLHLGVESGSARVLRLLNKPIRFERLSEIVRRLRQADIEVSLIFLLGAGGRQLAAEHVKETTELLAGLGLGARDRVYLSDLLVHPGSEQPDIVPLTRQECRQQAEALRQALRFAPPPRGTAISLYDVRQFVYT
ncbi:radical SAM protein [bacterium]|nr:radical SAM protein [bacterium]